MYRGLRDEFVKSKAGPESMMLCQMAEEGSHRGVGVPLACYMSAGIDPRYLFIFLEFEGFRLGLAEESGGKIDQFCR